MDETQEPKTTALERLREALPLIFGGFAEAEQQGLATLAIAARDPAGGGKMILTIEQPKELLTDIAEVCGITMELSKEQQMEYKAQKFLSRFNFK